MENCSKSHNKKEAQKFYLPITTTTVFPSITMTTKATTTTATNCYRDESSLRETEGTKAQQIEIANNFLSGSNLNIKQSEITLEASLPQQRALGLNAQDSGGSADNSRSQSNGSSLHDSTENLSFSSDNYYPDDLILIEEDPGGGRDITDNRQEEPEDGEELSVNSDDCVYAYRGDGLQFDLVIDALAGGGLGDVGRSLDGQRGLAGRQEVFMDDETDFLEMDYEPDPLSEVDGVVENVADAGSRAGEQSVKKESQPLLIQRDSCHFSGTTTTSAVGKPRQLFGSTTDNVADNDTDDLPPPPRALHVQSVLTRNSLHLDQIKGEESPKALQRGIHEMLDSKAKGLNQEADSKRDPSSPSKITGAKPKRLSATAAASSKSSTKSRRSNSSKIIGYDENCVSCTNYRTKGTSPSEAVNAAANTSNPPPAVMNPAMAAPSVGLYPAQLEDTASDYACLDCLEKEFLANTIGKPIDTKDCEKCRKRANQLMNFYAYAAAAAAIQSRPISMLGPASEANKASMTTTAPSTSRHTRCRSGSPKYYSDYSDTQSDNDFLYATELLANDLMNTVATTAITESSATTGRGQWLEDTAASRSKGTSTTAATTTATCSTSQRKPLQVVHANDDDNDEDDDIVGNEYPVNAFGSAVDWENYNVMNNLVGVEDEDDEVEEDVDYEGCFMDNQRLRMCDNFLNDISILGGGIGNNIERIHTISTVYCNEVKLVRALNELQATYNLEMIEYFFKLNHVINTEDALVSEQLLNPTTSAGVTAAGASNSKRFKNLKSFFIYESKRYCNYPKLKRLIELCTLGQVQVEFEEETTPTTLPLVPIKVAEVLRQWSYNRDLSCLQRMSHKFREANILGKIANLLRQSEQQQRFKTLRILPDYITIPQYYPNGYLVLTKTY